MWHNGRCGLFVPKPSSRVAVLGNRVSSLGLSVRQRPLVCVAIVTQLVTQPSLRVRRWPVRKREQVTLSASYPVPGSIGYLDHRKAV